MEAVVEISAKPVVRERSGEAQEDDGGTNRDGRKRRAVIDSTEDEKDAIREHIISLQELVQKRLKLEEEWFEF